MRMAARRAFATALALGLISACGGGEAAGGGSGGDLGTGGTAGTGGTGGDTEPFDRSSISFVDNLLVKVEAGEWTLGQGLVASLRLMVGEIDASSVLRHLELANYEGTGIVAMAYEYLEDGPDADARAEILRLLDLAVFSNERLESMAGLDAQSPALNGAPFGLKSSEEDCRTLFSWIRASSRRGALSRGSIRHDFGQSVSLVLSGATLSRSRLDPRPLRPSRRSVE